MALGIVAGLALPGCTGVVQGLGIPGASSSLHVERVTPRGDYLDVVLADADYVERVFTPDDEACRTLLTVGAAFVQPELETSGKITGPGISCEIAGRGNLDRRRVPRPPGQLATRGHASLRAIYADEEVIFARGRFPLTGVVGWARGDDTIAVLPNTQSCRERAADGSASIEFRPYGDPLILVGDPESCPLLGLVRPLD